MAGTLFQRLIKSAAVGALFGAMALVPLASASARVVIQVVAQDDRGVPSKIFVYRTGNPQPEGPYTSRPDGTYEFRSIQCSGAGEIKFSIEPQSRGAYSWTTQARVCGPSLKFHVQRTST